MDSLRQLLDTEPVVLRDRSENDEMFLGDEAQYLDSGRSALRNIRLALLAAERPNPRRILDLPCGHGRTMRYVRAAFPAAEIVGCDLNRDGVDWCAEHLSSIPLYSSEDPAEIGLTGQFDLIWCGSLLTHLDAPRWADFFSVFEHVLAPGGLALVTSHGRQAMRWMTEGNHYGLDPDGVERVLADVERDGFGYADYPGQARYGISLATPEWVVRGLVQRESLLLVSYAERAWHSHQDVIVCQKLG